MATRTFCDGCGKDCTAATSRDDDVAIVGSRSNDLVGGGLPAGSFEWCYPCARVAFGALVGRRTQPGGSDAA